MAKEKNNIEHLKDILDKIKTSPTLELFEEAIEFIDAIESDTEDKPVIRKIKKEINENEDKIEKLEERIEELEEELEESESDFDEVYLGLDTMKYKLDNGNLKIQMQFEHWCELVQKQNAVVPI